MNNTTLKMHKQKNQMLKPAIFVLSTKNVSYYL